MLLIPKWSTTNKKQLYHQVYMSMKEEIVAGKIAVGARLPSIRKMADHLAISTTPVEQAYQQLIAEGFIESRPKSGYYVQKLPEPYKQLGATETNANRHEQPDYDRPLRKTEYFPYDFYLSRNDFSAFPFKTWRRLLQQVITPERDELLFYGDPQGERGLREEIVRYLYQFRGVQCTAEQVVVAADQQILLIYLAQLLKGQLDQIGIENPGYPMISATFRQQGIEVVPIGLQEDGIHIGELYASRVRLVYISPSHQFPRGIMMPIAKRLQLLEWASAVGGFIIEDDYHGEFRYMGRPTPSLQGLFPDTPVIYMGGFSQALAPALCINYMVLPTSLLDAYHQLYQETLFEQSSSPLHQAAMQLFMQGGHWEKHIRKMRNIYRKKHDQLIESVQKHFGEKGRLIGQGAGFYMLMQVDSRLSEAELIQRAKAQGVRVSNAAFTWMERPSEERKEFFLGFSGILLEDIEPGIARLYQAWYGDEKGEPAKGDRR